MKITYYKPMETDLEIEGISLLTVCEVENLPEEIREYKTWWWLKTAGDEPDRAAIVDNFGFISYDGDDVFYDSSTVRPAVTIRNLESLNLEIGDSLMIQGKKYVYIGGSKALYNDEAVYHRFDAESNDYEQSEIKQIVENWLK